MKYPVQKSTGREAEKQVGHKAVEFRQHFNDSGGAIAFSNEV